MPIPAEFQPLFRSSPVLDLIGPLYSKGRGHDLCIGLLVQDKHCNARGAVHGGILATIADVALGYTMAYGTDPPTSMVTASLSIDYAGSAKAGQWLETVVDVQKQGARLAFGNCYISADGVRIARASGVFAVVAPGQKRPR
jgi:uncharacterized protein (TIGR00369 family)